MADAFAHLRLPTLCSLSQKSESSWLRVQLRFKIHYYVVKTFNDTLLGLLVSQFALINVSN